MISNFVRSTRFAVVVAAAAVLSGCAAAVVGGAVGAALVATDRRTTGAQLEDQNIEIKANSRVREAVGERGHVSATSYNRVVLLTGEVNTEEDRKAIETAVSRVENLQTVVNETAVMPNSTLGSRSNDTVLTTKIKATFVDAKDIQSTAIKVVTERATVFLMGRVTEREAARATELARGVPGVTKVIRVFELLSEEELANLGRNPKK
jgi:osmotically-inducible protein OsmY